VAYDTSPLTVSCEGSNEVTSRVYLEQLSNFEFLNKMLLHADRELITFFSLPVCICLITG